MYGGGFSCAVLCSVLVLNCLFAVTLAADIGGGWDGTGEREQLLGRLRGEGMLGQASGSPQPRRDGCEENVTEDLGRGLSRLSLGETLPVSADPPVDVFASSDQMIKWARFPISRVIPENWPIGPIGEEVAVVTFPLVVGGSTTARRIHNALESNGFSIVVTGDSVERQLIHGYRSGILEAAKVLRKTSFANVAGQNSEWNGQLGGWTCSIFDYPKQSLEGDGSFRKYEGNRAVTPALNAGSNSDPSRASLIHSLTSSPTRSTGNQDSKAPPAGEKDTYTVLIFSPLDPSHKCCGPDRLIGDNSLAGIDVLVFDSLWNYFEGARPLREAGFQLAERKPKESGGEYIFAYNSGMEIVKDNYDIFLELAFLESFPFPLPEGHEGLTCIRAELSKESLSKTVESREKAGRGTGRKNP